MTPRFFAAALLGLGCYTACLDAQSISDERRAGSIEIVKLSEGLYGYRVKNAVGKILLLQPENMIWVKVEDVRKVIQDLKITIATTPTEDPESTEEFKNKDFRYSFRLKNPSGTVVAIPPKDMQWRTTIELYDAIQEVKAVLDSVTPTESGSPALKAFDFRGLSVAPFGPPQGLTRPDREKELKKGGLPKSGQGKKNFKK